MKRKIFVGVGVLVLLAVIVLFGVSLYMLDYSLRPGDRGRDMASTLERFKETYPGMVSWIDSLTTNKALRDTFIVASDGTSLHAFYVRASEPTGRTAVIVHGYTDNSISMFNIGYMYNQELGCNVLLPDLRDAGLSGGDAIQMGWLDRKDVVEWIEVAPELFGDSLSMVVHGLSMGGATVMMTSGEDLPSYVKCFVEDCGYTSVWDQFSKMLGELFGLPDFPLMYTASWLCSIQNGWNFSEASSVEQVRKCRKPMMFIHGDADTYVPTWMVYKVYEAKPEPKELWVVPGAEHAVSYLNCPEEYTERVRSFLVKHLN